MKGQLVGMLGINRTSLCTIVKQKFFRKNMTEEPWWRKVIYTMVYIGILRYIMSTTTIKIQRDTKSQIDQFREYKNESYDEVIKKLIFIVKNLKKEPELSKETIKAIEAARERIKKGQFVSEEEATYRLGL
jgi:predicted transcriptional regulator